MDYISFSTAAALLLVFGSRAHAQIATTCPEIDICYALNIPNATASAGTGDIFFQISAPTSYQWVALGQGSNGMSGANIFVMYTSADGSNVTVSPRLGTGEVEPQHDTAAQISLLEGSGVSNGKMVGNVRCSSCDSWQGGSMDFSSSSAGWIHAYKSGSALNSDDLAQDIDQHDDADGFTWDFSQAKGGNDVNPFVAAAATGTNPSASASGSAPTTASASTMPTSSSTSSSQGSGDSGSSGSSGPSGYYSLSPNKQNAILLAHAVCACIAFVALLPIGAILIRVASFPGLLWTHVALQILAYAIYIVAVGLGLYMATTGGYMTASHPIIGLVLFGIIFFQPPLGWLHHQLFKKHGKRTLWSYAHLSIGRIAVLLGLVNGGLGLQLAGADRSAYIAYGVCAGVVGVAYLAAIAFGETERRKDIPSGGVREKDGPQISDRNPGSGSEAAPLHA